jgi:hypothetical protein
MVKQAYKIPEGTDIDQMKSIIGAIEAKVIFNLIQDINGDWFISQEEWVMEEWQSLKSEYPDFINGCTLVEFVPQLPIN